MSDDKYRESSGATATVVLLIMLLGLIAVTVVGGGAAFIYFRKGMAAQQEALLVAQAEAEMVAAEMRAQAAKSQQQAAAAATQVSAPSPEILVEISAAGDYILAGKPMEFYDDVKAELLAVYIERGPDLRVVISADKETRFDRVTKAVEAAECAGITQHRILTPTSQPIAAPAAPQP